MSPSRTILWTLGGAALAAVTLLHPAVQAYGDRKTTYVPVVEYATVYRASPAPTDLQVHIVGVNGDALEVYFNHHVARVMITETRSLASTSNILLAPASESGTFAVRHGPCFERFAVMGWDSKSNLVEYKGREKLGFESGKPVELVWITSRLLRITQGPGGEKTVVLKFHPDTGKWDEHFLSPAR